MVKRALLLLLLAAPAALAAPPRSDRPAPDDQQYQNCLTLAARRPEEAFDTALAWRDRGGGAPARHCIAMALVQLKQYGDAADRLEKLAVELRGSAGHLVPEVLSQAGNAWLLAGFPDRADAALTSALSMQPGDPDLYIDRARVRAARESFKEALGDLDAAVMLDNERADALAFRAAAKRALGDMGGAMEDADRALFLDREQVEALLERGHLKKAKGDLRGARADWLKVIELAAGTPAGDAAQNNLQIMDGGGK